ncbi:hypothetical protein E2C01_091807 [Portunus trituberculatus]|uniref:Uncharacterized protein n=1 Tax=Portunus trituberculatus TaxID=210409 RepID=A0A5B7JW27_PORTR|nr:hypothetical protein [Portunus trituberculatus]
MLPSPQLWPHTPKVPSTSSSSSSSSKLPLPITPAHELSLLSYPGRHPRLPTLTSPHAADSVTQPSGPDEPLGQGTGVDG